MNIHKNARLTPLGREQIVRMVEQGQDAGGRRSSRGRLRGPCATGMRAINAKA